MHKNMYNIHMPVVLRYKNIKIIIFFKDHNPPHVHVIGPGAEAKFEINPISCYFSRGFKRKFLLEMAEYLEEHKDLLIEAWSEYHE